MMVRTPILQFGTGRFLQAHVDLFVSEALDRNEAVGPITVVQTVRPASPGSRLWPGTAATPSAFADAPMGATWIGRSGWGRYLYAIGSNAEAARLTGVNVKAMIYLAYIVSAGLAAFVGVLLAARIGIGNATQGEGWELQAIASSVIGGTSFFGAVGSVQGPLLGSFILTTINNGANLLAINPFWQRIITGALIIIIVYFDQLRRKRR